MQTTIRPGAGKPPPPRPPSGPEAGGSQPSPPKPPSGPVPLLLLKAMRPLQWTKNVLLFAGLLFALKFTDPISILKALAGFAPFFMFSRVIFLLHDLRGPERD